MNEVVRLKATITDNIKRLKISNLDLKIKENTSIKANLELIDFSDWSAFPFKQEILEARIDMNEINSVLMPGGRTLNLGREWVEMGTIYLSKLNIAQRDRKLDIAPFGLNTNYGRLAMNAPLSVAFLDDGLSVLNTLNITNVLNLNELDLGKLLKNPNFGKVNGVLAVHEFKINKAGITIKGGSGEVNSAMIYGHDYKNLKIHDLNIKNNHGEIDVILKDPNADIELSGTFDISGKPNLNLQMKTQNFNTG
ncbi:MAG: hypothetical protein EBS34_08895 [Flavobacteriales bacterium]|nr:hypothetical protein [Flavobacteriales bacterium]